uniref:Uncharacterized protein n=1 Tax=viral metagenome TaxID=1070528 RepID=A0A2V0RB11_9ZZZZ
MYDGEETTVKKGKDGTGAKSKAGNDTGAKSRTEGGAGVRTKINTAMVKGVPMAIEPVPRVGVVTPDVRGAAALLDEAEKKLGDDNASKLEFSEGTPVSDVTNSVLNKVINLIRERGTEVVEMNLDDGVMARRSWPPGNLRVIASVDKQHLLLHETLPQLSVSPGDDPMIAMARMVNEVIMAMNLGRPFVYSNPNKEVYEWVEYANIGSDLRALRADCRNVRGIGQSLDDRVVNLLRSRAICRTGGDFDVAKVFDGRIRAQLLTDVAHIYWQATISLPQLYAKYAPMSPAFRTPYLNEIDQRARVFENHVADRRGIPHHFSEDTAEIAVAMMSECIYKLGMTSTNPMEVESDIARTTLAQHEQSSPLAIITGMLSSTEVGPTLAAVVLTCVFHRIRVSVALDVLDPSLANFLAAVSVMLIFPHEVLEEQTHRAAKQIIARGLGRTAAVTADISELTGMLQQFSLFQGFSRARRAVAASDSPFTTNTTYSIPLLTDANGRHVLESALPGTITMLRNKQMTPLLLSSFSNKGGNLIIAIVNRMMDTVHTRAASLSQVIAGFAIGVGVEWRDLELVQPLYLSKKSILSFGQLYVESGVQETFPFAMRVASLLLGITNAVIEMAPFAEGLLLIKNRGRLGISESVRLAEEIDGEIDSQSFGIIAMSMINRARARKGRAGVLRLLQQIAGFVDPNATIRLIKQLVRTNIAANLGAFGLTSYVILSARAIPPDVHHLNDLFEESPFRSPTCVQHDLSHADLRVISHDRLAPLIEDGVRINCMMSYDLIIDGVDNSNTTMETQPLCVREGGGYDLRKFAVTARLPSCDAAVSGAIRMSHLMSPKLHVYVSPRTNFHPVSDMEQMTQDISFLSGDIQLKPHKITMISSNTIPH